MMESMHPQQLVLRQQCRHPGSEVAELTPAEIAGTVHARFSRMAAAYPHKTAFARTGQATTYADIERMSNRIAWALRDQPGQKNEPIALLLQPGAGFCAAILGVAKAGFCYSALPPENPAERLGYILKGALPKIRSRRELTSAAEW